MHKSVFPSFFEGNHYFIDEKVGLLKFSNNYKVYDVEGIQIGEVAQQLSAWHKFLRLVINKSMMPFSMHIKNGQGETQASLRRGWTFWMSKIEVLDQNDMVVGYIKQKFKLFKPTFHIFNASELQIATIGGDWKAWNFSIKDASENEIGTITKKWNGFMKEAFTTADKYVVSIVPEYAEDINKMIIVATAITIDMVLKEKK